MDYILSLLFNFVIVLSALVFVMDIAKHLAKKKLIESLLCSPDEKRNIYIRSDSAIILVYKILFWMAPINLLIIPAIV